MSFPVTINVDTLEFEIGGHGFCLPSAETVEVYHPNGTLKTTTQNRVRSAGAKYGAHQFTLRVAKNGSLLKYSGSPFAYVCGQNVHTPGSVRDGCVEARFAIIQEFGRHILSDRNPIRRCDFRLTRVDLACNLDLKTSDKAKALVKQVKRQLCELEQTVGHYPTGFTWAPSRGEEYSIRGYMKADEMLKSGRDNLSSGHARLVSASAGIVRIEIQLRGRALDRWKLRNPNSWKPGIEQKVFGKYMALLPLSDIKGGAIDEDELQGMSRSCQRVLKLYANDRDWKKSYSKYTVRKLMLKMREYGWDMSQPFSKDHDIVKVKSALRPSQMMKGPPMWMIDEGLYPEDY